MSDQNESALSFEETNKMRAKLGLKPLRAPGAPPPPQPKQEDHAAAAEAQQRVREADIAARLEAARERRAATSGPASIADELPDEELDAAAWVAAQQTRPMARPAPHPPLTGASKGSRAYSARDAAGLTVGHALEAVPEGASVVLTLADAPVLADDDDLLENVNLRDTERAKELTSRKAALKKPVYDPFAVHEASLLPQYDDEKPDAAKRRAQGFQLGVQPTLGAEAADNSPAAGHAGKQLVHLEAAPQLAAEYYTADELARFKKRAAGGARHSRKKATGSSLLQQQLDAQPAAAPDADHGARSSGAGASEEAGRVKERLEAMRRAEGFAKAQEKARKEAAMLRGDLALDLDELQAEAAPVKPRPPAPASAAAPTSSVAALAAAVRERAKRVQTERAAADAGNLVFTATGEFVRQLQQQQQHQQQQVAKSAASVKQEVKDEKPVELSSRKRKPETDDMSEDSEQQNNGSKADEASGEQKAKRDGHADSEDESSEQGAGLAEEPLFGGGLASTLHLLASRGEAASMPELYVGRAADKVPDEYKKTVAGSGSGSGDVEIKYVDKLGRALTPKEAYRQMSHIFHGKKSGKNKTEKRERALEEMIRRNTQGSDAPLQGVAQMQKTQEKTHAAFIVVQSSTPAALLAPASTPARAGGSFAPFKLQKKK